MVFSGLLIGEHGEVLEGDAFLARKLLIGDPPVKPALPASGRYRLDNALLRLLRFPWSCFVVSNALEEDRFEPKRNNDYIIIYRRECLHHVIDCI